MNSGQVPLIAPGDFIIGSNTKSVTIFAFTFMHGYVVGSKHPIIISSEVSKPIADPCSGQTTRNSRHVWKRRYSGTAWWLTRQPRLYTHFPKDAIESLV